VQEDWKALGAVRHRNPAIPSGYQAQEVQLSSSEAVEGDENFGVVISPLSNPRDFVVSTPNLPTLFLLSSYSLQ
jgi:hypothetical protein